MSTEPIAQKTPWPIERTMHPSSASLNPAMMTAFRVLYGTQFEAIANDSETLASRYFEHPQIIRDLILKNVSVEPLQKFNGKGVFYLWLGKKCPVGCGFCFFHSPAKAEQDDFTEITDQGIDNLIKFSLDGNLGQFTISGGGEPMMAKQKVFRLARGVKTDRFTVVTSGYWARTKENSNKVLTEWKASIESNPHQPKATVRISLDQDHLKQLGRKGGFQYIQNILTWFADNAPQNPNFNLLFHTIEGDPTIEQLLATLDIDSREEITEPLKHKTKVTLKNGLSFRVEYSQLFDSNPKVDLGNREQLTQRFQTYHDYLHVRRNKDKGNQSLIQHDDGSVGLDYLALYDGTCMIWGATAPDAETTIYSHDYRNTMSSHLNDIITLAALEKGPEYIQALISEVNPKAVERAIGIHLRDFYPRLLLEEDATRLYLSIRLIQEYVAEGRISPQQIQQWPKAIQTLVGLDRMQLQEVYRQTEYNIVSQYLQDPEVSVEKLLTLYELVKLQHYDISPAQMVDQVMKTFGNADVRNAFIEATNGVGTRDFTPLPATIPDQTSQIPIYAE